MDNSLWLARVRRVFLLPCLAIACSIPLAHAKNTAARTLPSQTPAQIEARLLTALKQAGDLSAYIVDVNDDGTILIATQNGQALCGRNTKATLIRTSISKERLGKMERALEQVNKSLTNNTPIVIKAVPQACLGADKP